MKNDTNPRLKDLEGAHLVWLKGKRSRMLAPPSFCDVSDKKIKRYGGRCCWEKGPIVMESFKVHV